MQPFQAIQHEEQHHLQTAWRRWKQRFEKNKLKQMQHYHEDKLLKNTFVAWQVQYRYRIMGFLKVGRVNVC